VVNTKVAEPGTRGEDGADGAPGGSN
jgi:hypothetical protein